MAVLREQALEGCRFTIRPNCAMSWRRTKYLMLFFALCFALVGGYFAALGAWLVLPFAGLELAVLAGGLYFSALAGHTREVVEICGDDLRVLRGARRLREVARFSRHWSRAALIRDPRGWHPSRLFLRCHGRSVEISTRLVEAEREELAAALQQTLGARPRTQISAHPAPMVPSTGAAASVQQACAARSNAGALRGGVHAMTGFPLSVEGEKRTTCATGALSEK
jgi:uncharacterized membrane protein